jgi:16S rRNA (guanine527-N7)-methyltransferase
VEVHLSDSLAPLEPGSGAPLEPSAPLEPGAPRAREALSRARTIADLGAGAGFPGLALAVALPQSEVWLVESQARKCAFIESLCAAAGIGNARVICARVEEWRDGLGCHDVVTARALAPQAVVLEYAAPLLRLGGALVDWRGRREEEQERAASAAAGELGLELVELVRVEPYAGARDHHLHVYAKARETPERFPRRTGIARKRPLGAVGGTRG